MGFELTIRPYSIVVRVGLLSMLLGRAAANYRAFRERSVATID
jgi:hypothetical protein